VRTVEVMNVALHRRDSFVVGHAVRVDLVDSRWTVAVDGNTLPVGSSTAYAAWAIGVAESYRLSPTR